MSCNRSLLTPEILVPRLGEILMEKGLISQADLELALQVQRDLRAKGEDSMLGQIMVNMGMIDSATRDAVATEHIMQLKAALQEANEQLERRVAERTAELQKALAKLSELNQLKANIVANISHELRTPLTHLKGYLELILAGDLGPVNESQQTALQVMEKSADRLGHLIEDLILFSVSERDQIHLRLLPFSIANACLAAIQKSGNKARERAITLTLECKPDLPAVDGDEEKITWVILHFLDNALKFTQTGGCVSLRAVRERDYVRVSVADSGIGIPASRIDQIFESFYQLDSSTTRRAGGTGLGLALAKKIIEAHGSVIQVTSEVGRGSCFEFCLKIHSDEGA